MMQPVTNTKWSSANDTLNNFYEWQTRKTLRVKNDDGEKNRALLMTSEILSVTWKTAWVTNDSKEKRHALLTPHITNPSCYQYCALLTMSFHVTDEVCYWQRALFTCDWQCFDEIDLNFFKISISLEPLPNFSIFKISIS